MSFYYIYYASSYRIPINNYHIYSRNIYIIFKSGRKYYEILRNITEKDTNTHNILYFIKYNNSQKIMFL